MCLRKARNLTDDDRNRFNERTGRKMSQSYVSQVETKAGTVLAVETAEQVLESRARELGSSAKREFVDMSQARDMAMAGAVEPKPNKDMPQPTNKLEPKPDI